MKKIFGALIALYSAFAFSATTMPVQLLNPTGSTSGQAIVSTGPTTAPGWSTLGVGNLAAVAANTVLANATGSSAVPTAFAMPNCPITGNALSWSPGTGFVCNGAINAAQLLGSTWASPPVAGYGSTTPEPVAATTISATGLISPTSTVGIKGTTTNDSAQAGSIGEYVTATGVGVSLTTATPANITSISLTAGDWDVTGSVDFIPAASTTVSAITAGASTTSATLPAVPNSTVLQLTFTPSAAQVTPIPTQRISIASTTTVFLVAQSSFGTSTMTATGLIRARRVR